MHVTVGDRLGEPIWRNVSDHLHRIAQVQSRALEVDLSCVGRILDRADDPEPTYPSAASADAGPASYGPSAFDSNGTGQAASTAS